MQALKIIGLVFLSFLLLVLLIIFSVTFMANRTALNPNFITRELDRIDVSSVAIEVMEEEFEDDPDFPEELKEALYDTIEETEPVIKDTLNEVIRSVGNYLHGKTDELELAQVLGSTFLNSDFLADLLAEVDIPAVVEAALETDEIDIDEELLNSLIDTVTEVELELKEQIVAASGPIFDYILAETDSIDLKQTLRDTLLSTDFINYLIDNLDISPIISELIEDNIQGIDPDLELSTDALGDIVAGIGPILKQTIIDNTDDILDYLLGEETTISVVVSQEVQDDIEDVLRQVVLDNIPPEWQVLSQEQIDQRVDEFISDAMDEILGTTGEIDLSEDLFDPEFSEDISKALAEAEESLTEARDSINDALSDVENAEELEDARQYIGWFTMGYWGLIALIVVLILAIIAIYHHVKGASLHLGIMFLIIGIIECVVVFVGRGIAIREIAKQDIPAAVQDLPDQLIAAVTGPLAALSIGLIVLGIILIVASIIYPRLRRPSESD